MGTLKKLLDYACLIALAIGFAAVMADWRSLACWCFLSTIACGVAGLRVPAPTPSSTLSATYSIDRQLLDR